MKLLPGILKAYFSPDKKLYISLKNLLGFYPKNISLFKLAFTHRSAAVEVKDGVKISNERLEYLGDAILGAVVAEFLFKKFPFKDEGFLTEMRSRMVSRENLNKLAVKMGISNLIESNLGGSRQKSMYGDGFEALIGAIYLDLGYDSTKLFILNRIIRNHIDLDQIQAMDNNYKSRLLELAQKQKKELRYEVVDEVMQKKVKHYVIEVYYDGERLGKGMDIAKKKAEQIAAQKSIEILQEKGMPD
ncbi:MAG: ribonuclease III [Bacteroidia bacterium]|nr:ribonuclease III [Bacteroidia bacterium]